MNAIDELFAEHEAVRLTLKILKKIGRQVDETGRIPHTEHVDQLFDFFNTFVDRCHHNKEEQLLFPALEQAGISREGGPIGVMLNEHQQGRDLVAAMKADLSQYKRGDRIAARRFKKHADDYIALLDIHIDKENKMLFPMATRHLPANHLSEMKKGFDKIESEKIGAGKHAHFHRVLEEFEGIYLRKQRN
ncbi:MAG: hemerythrin domain-containing protein [Desulfobacteraceae bacterium]